MATVSTFYLEGIRDGRQALKMHGPAIAAEEIDNLKRTIKGFSASSPVGQMLRGELDFWKNQVKKARG